VARVQGYPKIFPQKPPLLNCFEKVVIATAMGHEHGIEQQGWCNQQLSDFHPSFIIPE
jgi:hypothetical protein